MEPAGLISAIPDLLAPDALGHLEGPLEIEGQEQFMEFQKEIFGALPDVAITIVKSIAEGEEVSVMWRASALDNSLTFRGTTWFRVVNGVIIEGWDCWDRGTVMAKLASRTIEGGATFSGMT